MTPGEKTELALIPALGVGVWLAAPGLPDRLGIGSLLLGISALLLFQGLVRDLWLLARAKRVPPPTPVRKLRCMCVESTVGATGVAAGVALLSAGWDHPIVGLNRWGWGFVVIVTLGAGWLTKDYVVTWGPWGIRRDRDHPGIVFTWKR